MSATTQQVKPGAMSTLGFVAFIVFIDMVGIGLIIPVMPTLLETITGKGPEQTALVGGWLLFSYAVLQFLFAPVIGGISDRYGRRPILLITLFLLGIDYAIMAWAPNLFWLFVGRSLAGVMGASWAAANSCVADVATREERGKYFGMLGGAGASGFVIGPAIGGVLGNYGERLPFVAASVLAIVGAIIGYFVLRETLPASKRRAFSKARANPLGTIIQMAKTPIVMGFLIVIFLAQLAAQSQMAVWSYYNKLRFDWSELEIGLSVALFGVLLAFTQGYLTGKVIARVGPKWAAMIGLSVSAPAYLIFAFAPGGWAMIVGMFVGALSGLSFPAIQQMMSERIAEDAQGELQGAVASMISITSIIGPLLMTGTFGYFADDVGLYFPGAPYVLAAIIVLSGLILLRANLTRIEPEQPQAA